MAKTRWLRGPSWTATLVARFQRDPKMDMAMPHPKEVLGVKELETRSSLPGRRGRPGRTTTPPKEDTTLHGRFRAGRRRPTPRPLLRCDPAGRGRGLAAQGGTDLAAVVDPDAAVGGGAGHVEGLR